MGDLLLTSSSVVIVNFADTQLARALDEFTQPPTFFRAAVLPRLHRLLGPQQDNDEAGVDCGAPDETAVPAGDDNTLGEDSMEDIRGEQCTRDTGCVAGSSANAGEDVDMEVVDEPPGGHRAEFVNCQTVSYLRKTSCVAESSHSPVLTVTGNLCGPNLRQDGFSHHAQVSTSVICSDVLVSFLVCTCSAEDPRRKLWLSSPPADRVSKLSAEQFCNRYPTACVHVALATERLNAELYSSMDGSQATVFRNELPCVDPRCRDEHKLTVDSNLSLDVTSLSGRKDSKGEVMRLGMTKAAVVLELGLEPTVVVCAGDHQGAWFCGRCKNGDQCPHTVAARELDAIHGGAQGRPESGATAAPPSSSSSWNQDDISCVTRDKVSFPITDLSIQGAISSRAGEKWDGLHEPLRIAKTCPNESCKGTVAISEVRHATLYHFSSALAIRVETGICRVCGELAFYDKLRPDGVFNLNHSAFFTIEFLLSLVVGVCKGTPINASVETLNTAMRWGAGLRDEPHIPYQLALKASNAFLCTCLSLDYGRVMSCEKCGEYPPVVVLDGVMCGLKWDLFEKAVPNAAAPKDVREVVLDTRTITFIATRKARELIDLLLRHGSLSGKGWATLQECLKGDKRLKPRTTSSPQDALLSFLQFFKCESTTDGRVCLSGNSPTFLVKELSKASLATAILPRHARKTVHEILRLANHAQHAEACLDAMACLTKAAPILDRWLRLRVKDWIGVEGWSQIQFQPCELSVLQTLYDLVSTAYNDSAVTEHLPTHVAPVSDDICDLQQMDFVPSLPKLVEFPAYDGDGQVKDSDRCKKKSGKSVIFTPGLVTLLCACPCPTVLGYFILRKHESPLDIVRLIRERYPFHVLADLAARGTPLIVIYDNACHADRLVQDEACFAQQLPSVKFC